MRNLSGSPSVRKPEPKLPAVWRRSASVFDFPGAVLMHEPDPSSAPLEPVEALMCICAIVDATADRDGSMPMEAAFRLINIVLDKALPSIRLKDVAPMDGDTPPD